jgi:hypothetical protein
MEAWVFCEQRTGGGPPAENSTTGHPIALYQGRHNIVKVEEEASELEL